MKSRSKEIRHAISGAEIGLIACLMVRIGIGYLWDNPADWVTLTSYGLAGLLIGTYFGYFLPSLEITAFSHPLKDKKA